MMLKTRTWIVIIVCILAISIAGSVAFFSMRAGGTVANIYQDGICVRSIDLSLVISAYRFELTGPAGTNHILVEPGRICVEAADCPDKVCVHQGWISDSVAPIVCLPNKLVIRVEGTAAQSTAVDTVTK